MMLVNTTNIGVELLLEKFPIGYLYLLQTNVENDLYVDNKA